MFCRYSNVILRYSRRCNLSKCRSFNSDKLQSDQERDPSHFFFNENVQTLLYTLTRVDLKKVYRPRLDGHTRETPVLKFMTEEQLQEALKTAKENAKIYLQMPPIVKVRSEIDVVLAKEPALQGFDTASYVFTDITYGVTDRNRLIVVRKPNGALVYATWEQRHRLNQIYFPSPGREIHTPKMFYGDDFKTLLEQHEYEFILDRACCQFDPDDPEFQRIRNEVYEHVNQERLYDRLRSTRHFGPMSFLLAWNKDMDNLLLDIIETGNIEEAVSLVKLYHMLHPDAESAKIPYDGDSVEFIKTYAELDAGSRIRIKNALATYVELEKERQRRDEDIKKGYIIESKNDA